MQRRIIPPAVVDLLLVLMTFLVVMTLGLTVWWTYQANIQISEISQRQIAVVQDQNEAQICAQHDIILATKSIAKSLGLPTHDILVPDVEGLDCASR